MEAYKVIPMTIGEQLDFFKNYVMGSGMDTMRWVHTRKWEDKFIRIKVYRDFAFDRNWFLAYGYEEYGPDSDKPLTIKLPMDGPEYRIQELGGMLTSMEYSEDGLIMDYYWDVSIEGDTQKARKRIRSLYGPFIDFKPIEEFPKNVQ